MQDLEPPEVPLELGQASQIQLPPMMEGQKAEQQPKKEGFFKRLFSKKGQQQEMPPQELQTLPDIDLPQMELSENFNVNNTSRFNDEDSALPELPSVSDQLKELEENIDTLENEELSIENKPAMLKTKSKGKAKKGQKRDISKIDESSQFDWTREIEDQEILIHDSNRFNQDVSLLVKDADEHVADKSEMIKKGKVLSEPEEVDTFVAPVDIDELGQLSEPQPEDNDQMPTVDTKLHLDFARVSVAHKKLRSMLNKYLKDKKLIFPNKKKLVDLLKMYDDNVEKYIEDKELELSKTRRDIRRRESLLKVHEQEIRDMHSYVKDLDDKLKQREEQINDTFTKNVERELTRRLKEDKEALGTELKKTAALNAELKKKIKLIEDDRIRFEKEHKNMSEFERNKLNELQVVYEKKTRDADAERKDFEQKKHAFEERRRVSLELLKVADTLSKEATDVRQMQEYVNANRKTVDKELNEDRELKHAIDRGEFALTKEKENLDGMIFSKYIENKLKSIRPEYLETREDWKAELKSNPLYVRIADCRKLLSQHNLDEAKSLYNGIRKAYDEVQTSRKEKEALYTAIRELYNDIQLRIVEAQMNRRA